MNLVDVMFFIGGCIIMIGLLVPISIMAWKNAIDDLRKSPEAENAGSSTPCPDRADSDAC